MPIFEENNRNWNHRNGKEGQSAGGPVNAEVMVHGGAEEWKRGSEQASHKGIRTNSTVRCGLVDIHDIVQALDEDHVHGHTDRHATDNHA